MPSPDPPPQRKRPASAKCMNPLSSGISAFSTAPRRLREAQYNRDSAATADILPVLTAADLPKRYTLHPPLLLLPATFTTHSTAWAAFYAALTQDERHELFESIAARFKGREVSHVAISAPIAADLEVEGGCLARPLAQRYEQNILRAPTDLTPVYGDFGPESVVGGAPSESDFEKAFWVSTSVPYSGMPRGVVQTWAPRWTMFSRGNVREKTRILSDSSSSQPSFSFPGLSPTELGQSLSAIDVVDFYVGIGYFATCYLARGVKRVWGWDVNPWSVEGLRRGCAANGWRCEVVAITEDEASGVLVDGIGLEEGARKLVQRLRAEGEYVRCVAFLGDNRHAADVMEAVGKMLVVQGIEELNVRHANLGLLPTSRLSWANAVRVLDQSKAAWLHVHENVDIRQIEEKANDAVREVVMLVAEHRGNGWKVVCEHVEQVKTYAPGVMHCVFDIQISVSIAVS